MTNTRRATAEQIYAEWTNKTLCFHDESLATVCRVCVQDELARLTAKADAAYQQGREAAQATALETLRAERDRLRAALVGLIGVDGREELEQLEAMMRLLPAPAEDRATSIDAIHALLATEAK